MSQIKNNALGVILCLVIALPAYLLGKQFPLIGGPVFAILLGMIITFIIKDKSKVQSGITYTSKKILQYAVILLGFGMNLSDIVKTGSSSLPIILSTITTSLVVSYVLCKLLKIPSKIATLIGVGSSICGGSAIAATAPVIEADDEEIAQAIDIGSARYQQGGRLIYIGAGTSGRLGVLDAAELVPTYGIKPERAIGLIAGGKGAMYVAVEGAEDDPKLAAEDLKKLDLSEKDVVIGLAASGRTPYVIGGLDYAQKVGAATIAIACVKHSLIGQHANIAIEAVTGAEVITGSTRMKAGTAQKMILNMISTGIMIRQGKVYQNVMIDVLPTNEKLVERAERIIQTTTNVSLEKAAKILRDADKDVGLAIVMAKTGLAKEKAELLLKKHENNVSSVLKENN